MNRFQAIILDKLGSYYEAYDEDTQLWCIFGSESGFCYFTYMTEDEAAFFAKEMNEKNQLYNHAYVEAYKKERRQKALKKLKELSDSAGPLPCSMLAIGPAPKKSLWNRISSFLSGTA